MSFGRPTSEAFMLALRAAARFAEQGDAGAAVKSFRLARHVGMAVYGEVSPEVAGVDSELGSACYQQGQLIRAFDFYESAYLACVAVHGEDSNESEEALANVNAVLSDLGVAPYVYSREAMSRRNREVAAQTSALGGTAGDGASLSAPSVGSSPLQSEHAHPPEYRAGGNQSPPPVGASGTEPMPGSDPAVEGAGGGASARVAGTAEGLADEATSMYPDIPAALYCLLPAQLQEDPCQWDTPALCKWLSTLGLSDVAQTFEVNQITGASAGYSVGTRLPCC